MGCGSSKPEADEDTVPAIHPGRRRQEEEDEDEERKITHCRPRLGEARRRRGGTDDEELPGSPSFRVYFPGSARVSGVDDDPVCSAVAAAGKIKEKTCDPAGDDCVDSTSSEGSEGKQSKRQMARRLMAGLAKRPSPVARAACAGRPVAQQEALTA